MQLWWPHTHGNPFLYEVRYDLSYLPTDYDLSYLPTGTTPRAHHHHAGAHRHHAGARHAGAHTPGGDGEEEDEDEEEEEEEDEEGAGAGAGAAFVHSVTAMHGVRTISTHVDETTTGRVFVVNGVPIFLQVSGS